MADDVINIILSKLDKIESKIDEHAKKLSEINAQLASNSELQKQQEKINNKVEEHDNKLKEATGAKGTVAWLITTAMALWAVIKPHL